jgi:hypothetical protein
MGGLQLDFGENFCCMLGISSDGLSLKNFLSSSFLWNSLKSIHISEKSGLPGVGQNVSLFPEGFTFLKDHSQANINSQLQPAGTGS